MIQERTSDVQSKNKKDGYFEKNSMARFVQIVSDHSYLRTWMKGWKDIFVLPRSSFDQRIFSIFPLIVGARPKHFFHPVEKGWKSWSVWLEYTGWWMQMKNSRNMRDARGTFHDARVFALLNFFQRFLRRVFALWDSKLYLANVRVLQKLEK